MVRSPHAFSWVGVVTFAVFVTAQETPPSKDQFGDPLPIGAVARIGTLRWTGRDAIELEFSPDGTKLAARCTDFTFRVYDVANGRELRRFTGRNSSDQDYYDWDWRAENQPAKKDALPRFAFRDSIRLPCVNGKRYVSVTADKRVRVVDTDTDKELGRFGPLKMPEMAMFSPDGAILAVIDNANFSIHLWNVKSGKSLGVCIGHEAHVAGATFSPDGKVIVSSAGDLTVRCWDPTTGKERWKHQGTGGSVSRIGMAFAPDSRTLAIGGWDGYIYLLDADTGKERESTLATRPERNGWVGSVVYHPHGKRLYVGTESGVVRECDAASGREIRRLTEPSWPFYSSEKKQVERQSGLLPRSCSPDGKWLALIGGAGVFLTYLEEKKPALHELPLAGGAHEAKFSPDGRTLAFGNVSLQLWDWRADKKVREIPLPARAGVGTLAFSLDSQTVATGGWDNVVRLWDVRTAKQRGVLAVAHQLHQAAFSPCGRFVAALDRQGSVRIWEIAAQKDRVVIDVERTALQAMAISPDGRWLALGGSDRAIYVFDLYTAEEVHQFHGHASYVTSLAFSPSGEFLASGAADSTALVWDARLFSQIRLRKPIKLTTKELESHVRDLGSDEGEKVFKAIHQLVVGGDPSVAFLRIAQSPVTKDDLARIPILLRDLDSEVLAVRNQAAKQLELLGEQAVPALEALRDKGPSPELLRRADAVLAKIRVIGPDTLRALRTVEVLEKIATPAAREVLRSLREGAPGVRLTEEARVALQRLEKNAK